MYTLHHCWAFDRFKCLVPSRKDWFRVLLTVNLASISWYGLTTQWMLVATSICLSVWGCGFCCMYCVEAVKERRLMSDLKHKYGYMEIPGIGFLSVPPDLFTPNDMMATKVFDQAVTSKSLSSAPNSPSVAVCLQVSLNAEEGLYWYHLMSAVRKPRSSKSWLNSSFFFAWIIISIITIVIPHCVIWIGVKTEVERAGKMYTVLGSLELM